MICLIREWLQDEHMVEDKHRMRRGGEGGGEEGGKMKGLCFLGVLFRSHGMRTGDYKKQFDLKPHMSFLGT